MNLNSDAFLDGLLNFFTLSSLNGFEHLLPYAVELLISLAIIDIATTWTLYDGQFKLSQICTKIIKYGFFFFLVYNMPTMIDMITESFKIAGLTAAGIDAQANFITPSALLDKGFSACGNVWESYSVTNTPAGTIIVTIIAMALTLGAFFFIALQVLLTQIELYIFTGLAVILVPFGALGYTSFLFQRVVSAVFSFSVKLMVMYFIVGLVNANIGDVSNFLATGQDANGAAQASTLSVMIKHSLSMLTLGLIVWKIPELAANIMSGNPTFTAGGAIGSMTGLATAAAGKMGAAAGVGKLLGSNVASSYRDNGKIGQALGKGSLKTLGATLGSYAANTRIGRAATEGFNQYSDNKANTPPKWFRNFEDNMESNLKGSIDNHVGKAVNSSVANANSEWARAGEKVRNFGNTEDAEKTSNKSDYKF